MNEAHCLSKERVDSESLKRKLFVKRIPSCLMLKSTWNISILPAQLLHTQTWENNLIFALVWMKTQIHSLPLGAAFGALNIAVSPVTLYTKQHYKHCFIRHYRQDEMKMRPIDQSPQISITQRRGLEKEWLSKLFGSCVCVCVHACVFDHPES